jgi:hypothetical protein
LIAPIPKPFDRRRTDIHQFDLPKSIPFEIIVGPKIEMELAQIAGTLRPSRSLSSNLNRRQQ